MRPYLQNFEWKLFPSLHIISNQWSLRWDKNHFRYVRSENLCPICSSFFSYQTESKPRMRKNEMQRTGQPTLERKLRSFQGRQLLSRFPQHQARRKQNEQASVREISRGKQRNGEISFECDCNWEICGLLRKFGPASMINTWNKTKKANK